MTKEFSEAQIQELQLALKDKKNNAHYRKLYALLLRSQGMSLTAIGKEVGLVHQAIRNLLTRYQNGGIPTILAENRGGHRRFYMTLEEEKHSSRNNLKSHWQGNTLP